MVLENDVVYYAMQVCGENGYTVIAEWFVPIAVSIILLVGFGIGFYVGYKSGSMKKC